MHDSRMRPLEKARERLKRAGVTNYSIAYKGIKLKFDWILADMPCSGLGTIRRNPDIKIYFNEEHLNELK